MKRLILPLLLSLLLVPNLQAQVTIISSGSSTGTFADNLFQISDDVDPTKLLNFQVSGVSTGTTRTLTVQNASYIIAGSNLTNSWTALQTFNTDVDLFLGTGNLAGFSLTTINTPDAFEVAMPATSNVLIHTTRTNMRGFDWAIALQSHPTDCWVSSTTGTEARGCAQWDGTQFRLFDAANTAANRRPVRLSNGSVVASAGTITPTGNTFEVSGTTGITAITLMGAGTCIDISFQGILTVTDNNTTLNLAGNFTTTADDTLRLCTFDGTNWKEMSRSVN